MFSKFFEWQGLIWLHHFVSYEYFRIMIWHGLNFEHFKNLEDLENLENLENLVFWTFWELTCSFRSILSSDLGLNSFESCFLSAELANSLEPSNGRGPFVRELIKHSSQKNTKYRDCIDDDSKLTICPFTVRLVHSMPKDTLFE